MFGDNSSGFANENEIIDYLNNTKYVDNLNSNFKAFLSFLFSQNLNGKTVSAYKPTGQVKPDIGIIIDENEKYVSVKKGSGNSVHQEQLVEFESFLDSCGVSKRIINYLKEFHYGDGSTDGNGGERIRASQWQAQNLTKITQINIAINTPDILMESLNRFLFIGNIPDAPVVDVVYHGNIEDGLWASREEIIEYLIPNHNNATTVHFSNLTYQVWNRNLNYNPKTANRRHTMQIKWPSLTKDFINITEKRV
jgi:hypothetical protein